FATSRAKDRARLGLANQGFVRALLGAVVLAHEEHVAPGEHRLDRALFDRPVVRDRLHAEIVGEERPSKAEAGPKQGGRDGSRKGRWNAGIERVVDHVRGHHRGDVVSQLTKRRELDALETLARMMHRGELEVAIEMGVAVAGKVLSAGHDSGALEATGERA